MPNEPGYCDHGKALNARCFFCGREGRSKGSPPATLPDHRNPPAEDHALEARIAASSTGGKEAARRIREKKARLRGESWADL